MIFHYIKERQQNFFGYYVPCGEQEFVIFLCREMDNLFVICNPKMLMLK
jgi:hypothetical protein